MSQHTGHGQIIDIGDQQQLFIDDRLVDTMKNLDFVLGRPELPREHLLPADQSWEKGRAGLWASLIHDGTRFHLWYDAYAWDDQAGNIRQDTHCFCYAVSQDGVRFEKPELGLFEVAGSRANNVVMRLLRDRRKWPSKPQTGRRCPDIRWGRAFRCMEMAHR